MSNHPIKSTGRCVPESGHHLASRHFPQFEVLVFVPSLKGTSIAPPYVDIFQPPQPLVSFRWIHQTDMRVPNKHPSIILHLVCTTIAQVSEMQAQPTRIPAEVFPDKNSIKSKSNYGASTVSIALCADLIMAEELRISTTYHDTPQNPQRYFPEPRQLVHGRHHSMTEHWHSSKVNDRFCIIDGSRRDICQCQTHPQTGAKVHLLALKSRLRMALLPFK
ncbi:unnamed protein product [Albugo candida]|uniref:Uncharacterized protein n=1 Tax=Albugo candida TaxID=65357 RepID=A0A024GVE7_9STRA|nr:unnamed protein product [Albugo candida]|eukprot:CCI50745.1 unnamed protein product [Albugo candida]